MGHPRKILQVTSYPPPRAGWGVRVQFLKRYLEHEGHECVVLNIGSSRAIPSNEYETVLDGWDYVRKVWRFARAGFVTHVHVNGASPKGFVLAIVAEIITLLQGRRCFLTFHAGTEQVYFPRPKYPVLLPMYRVLFTIPQAIICNSEDVKAKIVEYGVDPDKVIPIPAFCQQYLESSDGTLRGELASFYSRYAEVVFCYTKIRRLFFPTTLIEAFAQVAAARPHVGLVLCGIAGHTEPDVWTAVRHAISRNRLEDRIAIVDDVPHEEFLVALSRARVYVRTHLSDGVCSSVLEALALRVPVVASENHHRPVGVITYPPEDAAALTLALNEVLSRYDEIRAHLPQPELRDTLAEEARLLTT